MHKGSGDSGEFGKKFTLKNVTLGVKKGWNSRHSMQCGQEVW